MTIRFLASAAVALAFIATPVVAADDESLTRMTLCKDSWLDWKDDPAKLKSFGDHFRSEFAQRGDDRFPVPTKDVSVAGFRVLQAYPNSVGMGVGFSLVVGAPFVKVRAAMEREFGKKLQHCQASDGMTACELDIAEKRTFTVMAEDDAKDKTLIGCYYYYEK